MVDGIAQKPIEGVSMAYSFDKANANAPSPHKTQYFEMMGVQGLYDDGWMLGAVPTRPPWVMMGAAVADPPRPSNSNCTTCDMTGRNTLTWLPSIP